ncbi:hypothetical protein VNI00_013543 [Paramarasmius palmivorus]|uniref:F-box domain-containing protein n=1 Tax=Paramarasmius palmivorus TaxID=297713 RepID=A0AAW0BV12_9AGAR
MSRHPEETETWMGAGGKTDEEDMDDILVKIGQCKDDIDMLQYALAATEARKSALQDQLARRRYAQSAVRKVPFEIWREIFTEVCLASPVGSFWISTATNREPIVSLPTWDLSHVCSTWRRIVQDCPALWSSITVNLHNLNPDISIPLQTYLINSKDHPLNIEIVFDRCNRSKPDGPPFWLTANGRTALFMLVGHASRWKELSLSVESGTAPEILLSEFTSFRHVSFPLLRKFSDKCYLVHGHPFGLSDLWFWHAVGTAPMLSHLFVECSITMDIDRYTYHQLTNMEIGYVTVDDSLFEVLESCTNVQVLTLQCLLPRELGRDRVLTLSSLQELTASFIEPPDEYAYFFASITLPSLQILDLRCSYNGSVSRGLGNIVEVPPALIGMLERSADTLENLTLEFGWTYLREGFSIPEILRKCYNLKHLHFSLKGYRSPDSTKSSIMCILDTLIKLIVIPRSNDPVLAPKLESLSIHEAEFLLSPTFLQAALQVVESRCAVLKSLWLTFGDEKCNPTPVVERHEWEGKTALIAQLTNRLQELCLIHHVEARVYPVDSYSFIEA